MRALTPREQALYDIRLSAVRRWANRMEDSPNAQRMFARASVDAMAATARTRQDLLYKAVLVEPTGDVPHHILTDTVWGYFRNDMRIGPTVFYAHATSQWATLYSGPLPADYRRATVAANGDIEPTMVSDTEIPGGYRNVPDAKVMEFLNGSGGRVIPLAEIPDPYPPLGLADLAVSGMIGGAAIRQALTAEGGKPPLRFAVTTVPTDEHGNTLRVLITGGNNLAIAVPGTTRAGTFVGALRVTDALGNMVTSKLTVTATAVTGS